MALLHEATLRPRKDELIGPWLRTRSWWDGVDERGPAGSFRLDDPAGEVGIECFLFGSASGSTLFVPVTYRAAPLPDGEDALVGTMEHSVLGTRYVHDACADPVFVATVLDVVRTGGRQADELLRAADGSETVRTPAVTARGTGDPALASRDPGAAVVAVDGPDRTTVDLGDGRRLTVLRRLGAAPSGPALVGGFVGGPELTLAFVGQ